MAAQCCHAALAAYQAALRQRQSDLLQMWESQGQPKITLRVRDEAEMLQIRDAARTHSLITASVKDAGHTQVVPGTRTVLAIGPGMHCASRVGPTPVIDYLCGHLKLY